MTSSGILFQHISFRYESAGRPLFEGLATNFSAWWTGIVGANGAGKTTLLRLATGELAPDHGQVRIPGAAIYCPQRTDDVPDGLQDLTRALDGDAREIATKPDIEPEWTERWNTLSHGERKRAQIAVALWARPHILAVDEPTNHLDLEAQDMVAEALHSFRGVGLLVSHDRELLDTLCRQCLFVDPPKATLRPGGVTRGTEEAGRERASIQKEREMAKRTHRRIEREFVRRRDLAARSHKLRSKRGLGKDNDARFKRNLARYTGKDATGGRLMRQIEGRMRQAREKRDGIKIKKTHELGIWLSGGRSKRDLLLNLTAESIPLGGRRHLTFSDLAMRQDERIALTGPNGAGKSTLVRHLLRCPNVPATRLIYVPQEIDLTSSGQILDRARVLSGDELGRMMAVVSRLGSRPDRLLESAEPSPGETRKLLLALGIARVPHLIVMDEPTNHMDLPSIECLEEALGDCPCGLLLVSHDRRLLERLTTTRWQISRDGGEAERFVLDVQLRST